MSFCSFWDYTVLQRFREYDAPRSENRRILDYTTSANNRDGLAIRAAGDGLLARSGGGENSNCLKRRPDRMISL